MLICCNRDLFFLHSVFRRATEKLILSSSKVLWISSTSLQWLLSELQIIRNSQTNSNIFHSSCAFFWLDFFVCSGVFLSKIYSFFWDLQPEFVTIRQSKPCGDFLWSALNIKFWKADNEIIIILLNSCAKAQGKDWKDTTICSFDFQ